MNYKQRFLRVTRKTADILPFAWGLAFAIALLGQLLPNAHTFFLKSFSRMVGGPLLGLIQSDPYEVFTFYFEFLGIWGAFLLFVVAFAPNVPMLRSILPNARGNTWKWLIGGIALGFALNGFCILASVLHGVIDLSFAQFNPFWLLLIFFGVLVQSGAEEVTCRVYLYQKLRRRYKHPAVAIVGNSLCFALFHLANPGVGVWAILEIALIGVFFSMFVYYFDSVWACIGMHTMWNFTQNILFGLPNSGIVSQYSMFKLDAATDGFFFDPAFGVEGSIGSCLVLLVACVITFLIARAVNQPREDLWAEQERTMEAC